MREHYALGIGSGSRSVEKGSQIIRLSRNWSEFSVVPREYAVEISCRLWGNGDPRPSIRHNLRGDSRPRLSCRAPPGICQHNADFRPRYRLLRHLKMLLITNKQRSSAILQQLRNLIRMIRGVQWYRRPARSNDSQIRGHPSRMIVRKDRNPLARRHGIPHQPTADGFCHTPQFRVGVTLNSVRLLDLNRNILRPALSALDEAIVKSGHQCGKYTRKS